MSQLNTGESNMNLSEEIKKIVRQTIQDYLASQNKETVLDGNTVLKGELKVPIININGCDYIRFGDDLIAPAEMKGDKLVANSVHKKAAEAFDELILRYGFVVMSEVAKSKI